MELLADGESVTSGRCEGRFVNFGDSDGDVFYSYARRPEELNEVKEMIHNQMAYLSRLQAGLEVAQRNAGARRGG